MGGLILMIILWALIILVVVSAIVIGAASALSAFLGFRLFGKSQDDDDHRG